MAGGRPSEYTPDIPSKVEKYLTECAERKFIPTKEGLAVFLDVSRSTIYKWAEETPEFSDIFERLMAKQADKLIQGGLDGSFNAPVTKMLLTKHEYSDKQEIDHTTGGKALFDSETASKAKGAIAEYIKPPISNATAPIGPGENTGAG